MFGIDLGTTYSAIAVLEDGKPRLVPNVLGDVLTPSVVAFDKEGRTLVGKPAREAAVVDPSNAAAVFKRHMGTSWTKNVGGRARSATELSAILLARLRRDAEEVLGCDIDRAVITVPAYFNDDQRKATIDAGRAAGLDVTRVINEPTAAAIAYGLHDQEVERTAAVVDLGGGTFDVSIIDQFEGVVEVKASAGEIFLGGEDFTTALVARVLQRRGFSLEAAELKHPTLVSRLRHECERAKRALSKNDSVEIRWPSLDGETKDVVDSERVTRQEFEEWSHTVLTRIARPLRRALGDSHLAPDEVDEVILVGGATRMPSLINLVRKLFGKDPQGHLHPDQVVALGAAVQAGLIDRDAGLGELMVTDVAPFTLGIEISREIGNQTRSGYFNPIIPRNTPLPTSRCDRVVTLSPNQKHIGITIYQGEARRVEDNLKLGEFSVDGIPPGPAGQEVDVRFTYDLNGVLEAEATVVKTKRTTQLVLSNLAKTSMSADEIRNAVAAMQELKTDLRDEPANQLLLIQAERLVSELDLDSRNQLDGLLTAFEHALDIRDEPLAAELRQEVTLFLSAHDLELDWDGRPEDRTPPDEQ